MFTFEIAARNCKALYLFKKKKMEKCPKNGMNDSEISTSVLQDDQFSIDQSN